MTTPRPVVRPADAFTTRRGRALGRWVERRRPFSSRVRRPTEPRKRRPGHGCSLLLLRSWPPPRLAPSGFLFGPFFSTTSPTQASRARWLVSTEMRALDTSGTVKRREKIKLMHSEPDGFVGKDDAVGVRCEVICLRVVTSTCLEREQKSQNVDFPLARRRVHWETLRNVPRPFCSRRLQFWRRLLHERVHRTLI